jgi:hypothetical protein
MTRPEPVEAEGEQERAHIACVKFQVGRDHLPLQLFGGDRRAVLEVVQHEQNMMVLDGVEERGEEKGRERDRDGHGAQQRAQAHRQEHEEGRIGDNEEIIEPEIDAQPERMHRLIAECGRYLRWRRRKLEELLREEAGGQNGRHHDDDDRRRQKRKCGPMRFPSGVIDRGESSI